MDKVKIFALGGLDENGKNLTVVEVNDVIFIIECGIMIPQTTLLGVDFVIPDFTYLIKNQHRIGGIFITHGHDDVMRGITYLVKQLNIKVPIYTGEFTSYLIETLMKKEELKNYRINIVHRSDKVRIRNIDVRTFAITHGVPDSFGIAIKTNQGYIVYAGEQMFDFDIRQDYYACDINEMSEIGKMGVLCLMVESLFADKPGHTAPHHRIRDKILPIIEKHSDGRIIVAVYKQSFFRIMEILKIAKEKNKRIMFHDNNLRNLLIQLKKLNYFDFPDELIVDKDTYDNDDKDCIVIVSGTGKRLYLKMLNIATQEDPYVQLESNDTVIIVATSINGTEKEAVNMENEVYREGGTIYTLDSREVKSMHPSSDDIKMMLYLFRPKYFFPIKGEYRQLLANADLAVNAGYTPDRIIVADNGQVARFDKKALVSMSAELELNDTLVDGDENWDVTGVVLKDREILSKDGVMIIGVALNFFSKEIISGIDVQTRGLIYLKDAEHIVKEVQNIMEETIVNSVKERRYDNIEIRMEAREKIARYLIKETGKRPMILPVILEMNV